MSGLSILWPMRLDAATGKTWAMQYINFLGVKATPIESDSSLTLLTTQLAAVDRWIARFHVKRSRPATVSTIANTQFDPELEWDIITMILPLNCDAWRRSLCLLVHAFYVFRVYH